MHNIICCACMNPINNNYRRIFDSLYVCDQCTKYMLEAYVYLNPIKILCPTCNADPQKECKKCHPQHILSKMKKYCKSLNGK